ncbi:hypothetical protein MPSEU_000588900 [Mayamaea pseudoterrestris]|nr:hypothetical protein MPSEU_000588900 [Mayamaea pseudoterrestris]
MTVTFDSTSMNIGSKPVHPKTPHPNKKPRKTQVKQHEEEQYSTPPEYEATAAKEYLDAPPNDDGAMNPTAMDEQVDLIDQAKWADTISKLQQMDPNSPHYKNAQAFLEQQSVRDEAQERVVQVFAEQLDFMMDKIKYFTETLAGESFRHYSHQIGVLDSDVCKLVTENHGRRKIILGTLEQAKSAFDAKCENLMSRVLKVDSTMTTTVYDVPHDDDALQQDGLDKGKADGVTMSGKKRSADGEELPGASGGKDGADDEELKDPDWDEIVELYPPSMPVIQAFLDGRTKVSVAEEEFERAMQKSCTEFTMTIAKMKEFAMDALKDIDDPLNTMQFDIQNVMMSNVKRRERYEQLIQQRAEAAKSLFSRLMSRTAGGVRRVMTFNKSDKKQK